MLFLLLTSREQINEASKMTHISREINSVKRQLSISFESFHSQAYEHMMISLVSSRCFAKIFRYTEEKRSAYVRNFH